MQIDLARYDEAVHRIYDAALRPEHWPDVLASIARMFEAPRAMLFTFARSPTQGGFVFAHNMPAPAMALWAAKSMREDPFVKSAVQRGLMVEGVAVNSADLVPWDDLVATSFYQEMWAPVGIAHMCCGVVFDATDDHKLPTAVSFMRDLDDPPFQSHHPELLRRVIAHLSRAMGVMFHLRDQQLQVAASLSALERLSSGVVLLDGGCVVLFANAAAQSLFRRGDSLLLKSVRPGEMAQLYLHPRFGGGQERAFQNAVASALQPLARDAEQHFSQALLLPGIDGQPRYVVHVSPLPESHAFIPTGASARAIAFVYDLQIAASVPPALLCKLFDMTNAEARAALELTRGGSIDDMALRLGVSSNTLKTQLQVAYVKSGTHRQTDLLKLLLSLASR